MKHLSALALGLVLKIITFYQIQAAKRVVLPSLSSPGFARPFLPEGLRGEQLKTEFLSCNNTKEQDRIAVRYDCPSAIGVLIEDPVATLPFVTSLGATGDLGCSVHSPPAARTFCQGITPLLIHFVQARFTPVLNSAVSRPHGLVPPWELDPGRARDTR